MRTWFALCSLLVAAPLAAAEPTLDEIMRSIDDLYRGSSTSVATMEMHVKTSRWQRTLKMKSWTSGTEKSLTRILEPKKEKGTSTLKVGKDIWNYLPKVDRTIKVPGSMMSGSWMGSHFSNDDLVQESRYTEDFDCVLQSKGDAGWNIMCKPKPEAPVVWGRVELGVGVDRMPLDTRYYDEKGTLIRTMSYLDVKEVGGKRIPSRMKLVPADKPEEYTEFIYVDAEFGAAIPDSVFSLQGLKK